MRRTVLPKVEMAKRSAQVGRWAAASLVVGCVVALLAAAPSSARGATRQAGMVSGGNSAAALVHLPSAWRSADIDEIVAVEHRLSGVAAANRWAIAERSDLRAAASRLLAKPDLATGSVPVPTTSARAASVPPTTATTVAAATAPGVANEPAPLPAAIDAATESQIAAAELEEARVRAVADEDARQQAAAEASRQAEADEAARQQAVADEAARRAAARAAATPPPAPAAPAPAVAVALSAPEAEALSYLNDLRVSLGLPGFVLDPTLTSAARNQAAAIASAGALSHQNLRPYLASFNTVGENVGYANSVARVHNALVNSAPHYANMTNPAFGYVGIGIVQTADGRVWIAQVFGG